MPDPFAPRETVDGPDDDSSAGGAATHAHETLRAGEGAPAAEPAGVGGYETPDLTWVDHTMVVREGDPAQQAMEQNPGWHLLHVTGGLYGPVEYVFGWGDPPASAGGAATHAHETLRAGEGAPAAEPAGVGGCETPDLTWVDHTMVVREGDPAQQAMEQNPGWHLLEVTGGLYGPVEYVFGWGDPPASM